VAVDGASADEMFCEAELMTAFGCNMPEYPKGLSYNFRPNAVTGKNANASFHSDEKSR
jgi:hypothetical protein